MPITPERPLPDFLSEWLQTADREGAVAHKVDAFFQCDPETRRERTIFQLKTREELQRLRSLLDGPLVLLKGLEVAQLYPEPWQRDFIDIDLLSTNIDQADQQLRVSGYEPLFGLQTLPDYHQTAALARPGSPITVELHRRPHWAAWSRFPTAELIETAQPSRTGTSGLLRPRDDLHAVIIAWHYWRDGAHRCRDLLDVQLLREQTTDAAIDRTASEVGMTPVWRRTRALLDGLSGQRRLTKIERPLVRLEPITTRQRRVRQWASVALGGLGASTELSERLLRREQRRRSGAPL